MIYTFVQKYFMFYTNTLNQLLIENYTLDKHLLINGQAFLNNGDL